MNEQFDISVVFPSRERPEGLKKCIFSLLDKAKDPTRIEILVGLDSDDLINQEEFQNVIAPNLDERGVTYTAILFPPIGYGRLHEYVNKLSAESHARWIMMWNDDAVMITENWDEVVLGYDGEFALLRAESNNEHPYAIFPIVPRKWVDIVGHFSMHSLNDAWVSQIGYLLDIVVTIPVYAIHDRADLTGNNKDDTYKNRTIFEGNPRDPRDFNHHDYRLKRFQEAAKLQNHLASIGKSSEHFLGVLNGTNPDPWAKMLALDKNNLMKKY